MAKKKRRYKKKKGPCGTCSKAMDNHHLFWTRRQYAKGFWANKLRLHPYCIVLIPKNTLHKEIHSEIPEVPIPKECICESVYNQLKILWEFGAIGDDDSLQKRVDLLVFCLKCVADETVEVLEKQKEIANRYTKKAD